MSNVQELLVWVREWQEREADGRDPAWCEECRTLLGVALGLLTETEAQSRHDEMSTKAGDEDRSA